MLKTTPLLPETLFFTALNGRECKVIYNLSLTPCKRNSFLHWPGPYARPLIHGHCTAPPRINVRVRWHAAREARIHKSIILIQSQRFLHSSSSFLLIISKKSSCCCCYATPTLWFTSLFFPRRSLLWCSSSPCSVTHLHPSCTLRILNHDLGRRLARLGRGSKRRELETLSATTWYYTACSPVNWPCRYA